MSAAMSFVALRLCSASLRTSSATTANPRPASPARAASMAAFSASKLVCSVMSLITLMISEISRERSPRDLIFLAVACTDARMRCMPSSVSRTARLPCSAASSARRAASALASALFETCFIETVSSSTALDVFVISWSCCVAPALKNFGEIVEHVVDRVRYVSKGVVGHLAALCQITARNLVDDTQQFRDAALQRVVGVLVARSLGDLGDRTIQVFRNVAQFIIRLNLGARARVARGQTFGKLRQRLDQRQQRTEPPCEDAPNHHRECDSEKDTQPRWRAKVEKRRFTGLLPSVECNPQNEAACQSIHQDQRPDCGTQSRFHTTLQISSTEPAPSIGVVSKNFRYWAPEKPRAAGANQSPAPSGRHAATFRCNAARFPELARANPRCSPNRFR